MKSTILVESALAVAAEGAAHAQGRAAAGGIAEYRSNASLLHMTDWHGPPMLVCFRGPAGLLLILAN